MSVFIPASPRDLTPEWVTAAMRESGALPTCLVTAVEVESLSDGGTGFTGDTVRVRLRYEDGASGPESVIAKFPTSDRQNRGMLEQFDAYAREIRFYRRYAHRMPCPTPGYLGGDFDERGARRTGPWLSRLIDGLPDWLQLVLTKDVTRFMRVTKRRYALLIEDLGSQTTVHDLAAPPDTAQLGDALDVLARVHAAFWNDPSLHGDPVFRPIITTTPGLYQTVGRKRCLDLARQRWDDWLTPAHVDRIRDALDRFPTDIETINEKVTLIHGDPRSDNILYRHDGQVVLLDWALVGHAHPGFDVGYLLSSCVTEDHSETRQTLVTRYLETLRAEGVTVDDEAVRSAVDATYRALTVQMLMSIAVLHGDDYDGATIFDLWMPRLLDGLADD